MIEKHSKIWDIYFFEARINASLLLALLNSLVPDLLPSLRSPTSADQELSLNLAWNHSTMSETSPPIVLTMKTLEYRIDHIFSVTCGLEPQFALVSSPTQPQTFCVAVTPNSNNLCLEITCPSHNYSGRCCCQPMSRRPALSGRYYSEQPLLTVTYTYSWKSPLMLFEKIHTTLFPPCTALHCQVKMHPTYNY